MKKVSVEEQEQDFVVVQFCNKLQLSLTAKETQKIFNKFEGVYSSQSDLLKILKEETEKRLKFLKSFS